ncbi:hypothetical protein [Polynucleobacter asymbioticus]|uniref:Glycosyltransferase n=1 Tax=Polynucleobacter asymbioticus TaxID=576611 RepID=A0AAC9IWR8_9BURK|nr:hypothetical protein [Polynucleobacter asymbioticus]APB98142.1 hypothetical protein A4F89_01730 [Polynucleobacter asymbioticus]APC00428.1 hypothetical protein AOC25_01735 [Polynucleobacter asymbioticus]
MKIGFHSNSLTLRGAEIALFDYAFHNQRLLHNESVVFYKKQSDSDPTVLAKFEKYFPVFAYESMEELEHLAQTQHLDLMYFIKSGERDHNLLKNTPSAIHAVFPVKPDQFHGDRYAFVSQWLSKECSNEQVPYVPHMIDLPFIEGDLRDQLQIPKDATVLGCYGGSDSFNLAFVKEVIAQVLQERNNLYFLFMNIAPFAANQHCIFLPGNSDMQFKMQFINTCDGMLHARGIGESFGIACGEFSIKGKPVITYAFSPQRSHIEILGDKAILYQGRNDLKDILLGFHPRIQQEKNWDAYSEHFSPEPVMRQFEKVFLQGAPILALGYWDRLQLQKYRLLRKVRNLRKKLYL